MRKIFMSEKQSARALRARALVRCLKKLYPKPKTELQYTTDFQLVVAVILSAQCTDKKVNEVTISLFKKYKNPKDFANAVPVDFQKAISSISFFRNKTKSIIGSAKMVVEVYGGNVPKNEKELVQLPGVGYKTAHVILGELFDIWEGIATDTHVRRFALRFDLTDNKDLTKISKDLEKLIPKKDWRYVNNGFVLYGRHVCPAHPHECKNHPLSKVWREAENRWPKAK